MSQSADGGHTDDGHTDDGYLLDNRQAEAGERFDALAALFDASTFRHVDDLGIEPGRRCWEVGAGGSSVVRGLAERVGPAAEAEIVTKVVATATAIGDRLATAAD